jgi:hypothetical protein
VVVVVLVFVGKFYQYRIINLVREKKRKKNIPGTRDATISSPIHPDVGVDVDDNMWWWHS